MFGVEAGKVGRPRVRRRVVVVPGRVTLIGGDSGSGKTTLLRRVGRRRAAAGGRVLDPAGVELDGRVAVIDTFGEETLGEALAILSRAGLAEAGALLRPATALSEGQQFRYRLARVLAEAARCGGPAAIVADEFGATLDAVTARVVAFGLRKRIAGTRVAAVLVSPREDLEQVLRQVAVVVLM
jgi:ABC-type ATPase with predicted acetyltransferase domain